jgi:hypothetical protein
MKPIIPMGTAVAAASLTTMSGSELDGRRTGPGRQEPPNAALHMWIILSGPPVTEAFVGILPEQSSLRHTHSIHSKN